MFALRESSSLGGARHRLAVQRRETKVANQLRRGRGHAGERVGERTGRREKVLGMK